MLNCGCIEVIENNIDIGGVKTIFVKKMNADSEPFPLSLPLSKRSGSLNLGSKIQPNAVVNEPYTYSIDSNKQMIICYYLNRNNVWEMAANLMGYSAIDIIKIKKLTQDKKTSPAELLLSLWHDQNHTVSELYMVLYRLEQYEAMKWLKDEVSIQYRCLLLYTLAALDNSNKSQSTNESDSRMIAEKTMQSVTNRIKVQIHEEAKGITNVSYAELTKATDNWNEKLILGRGGFGIVYKGFWKSSILAIKKIRYHGVVEGDKRNAEIHFKQCLNELRYLNIFRHDNILALYGFSWDPKVTNSEPCLLYQYMAAGSLERRLHINNRVDQNGKPLTPLTFYQRVSILKGTAHGLQYLHTLNNGEPLIHTDIKPANILLDEHYRPKIGDFGLARIGSSHSSVGVSAVFGTAPYLPNEYLLNKELTTKVDTFSFGVMLFEVLTAMKAHDKQRGTGKIRLAQFMWEMRKNNEEMLKFMDKNLDSTAVSPKLYTEMMEIGFQCTEDEAEKRPEMFDVYVKMNDSF